MLSLPSLPSFPLVAPSKLVKLLLEAEASSCELLRLRSLAGTVREMHRGAQLRRLLLLLLPATHLASGIQMDADTLVGGREGSTTAATQLKDWTLHPYP